MPCSRKLEFQRNRMLTFSNRGERVLLLQHHFQMLSFVFLWFCEQYFSVPLNFISQNRTLTFSNRSSAAATSGKLFQRNVIFAQIYNSLCNFSQKCDFLFSFVSFWLKVWFHNNLKFLQECDSFNCFKDIWAYKSGIRREALFSKYFTYRRKVIGGLWIFLNL